MNDSYILNGTKSLIYAICLYDFKQEKIVLFQVSNNKYIINAIKEIAKFEL